MVFKKPSGRDRHVSSLHPDHYSKYFVDTVKPRANTRSRFTNAQKAAAIEKYYDYLVDPSCQIPYIAATKWVFGAVWQKRRGHLRKWLNACGSVRNSIKRGQKRSRRHGAVRPSAYPDCEDELYVRFIFRRTALGYPCNHFWLITEFKKILTEVNPDTWNGASMSKRWAVNFCVRFNISTQAKNNIKDTDQVDRLEAIQAFHQYLILVLQMSAPQLDSKYGRFSPNRMFHVDQVPLPFACDRGRTLNPRGAKSCRIAGVSTSGLEKRQATVQLWICAEPSRQIIKPTIIFRGSRGPKSKLPWASERAIYDTLTNVRVAFQPNAWADEIFCSEEILHVAADLQTAGIEGEVLIGMDNHVCQRTPAMFNMYNTLGMVPVFTSANCTDCISPVDQHIGRFIQTHMGRSYRTSVEADQTVWIADNDNDDIEDPACSAAMERRMLMAQWLSTAWTDLTSNHSHMIESAFIKTGFKIAKDGSEDHLIDIQGWAGTHQYNYRTV